MSEIVNETTELDNSNRIVNNDSTQNESDGQSQQDPNRVLNSAITKHVKPLRKEIESLKAELSQTLSELKNKFADVNTKPVNTDNSGRIVSDSAETNALKLRLEELEAKNKLQEEESKKAKEETRQIKKRDFVKSELVSQGFSSEVSDLIVDAFEYRKQLDYEEKDGKEEVVIHTKEKGKLPFKDGLNLFMQTELAKQIKIVPSPKSEKDIQKSKSKSSDVDFSNVFQKINRR